MKQFKSYYRSCSKKLEALDYAHKMTGEPRKVKKKMLKKQAKIINILPISVAEEEVAKPAKKKRTRLKRQKAINLSNLVTEINVPSNRPEKMDKLDKIDSLRLFGVAKLPKPESKLKAESKRKFRKGGLVVTAATNIPKTKPKLVDPTSEDSSSDEMPISVRPRTAKKKKKTVGKKKRILSANVNATK